MDNEQLELLTSALADTDVEEVGNVTSALATLVARVDELNTVSENLQNRLNEIEKEKRNILEELIPSVMLSQNISEIKLLDGRKLVYKEEYFASVTEAKKPAAWAWFRANGLADIIKNKFEVVYTAGQAEDAANFKKLLDVAEVAYTCKEDVHSSTLKSTVNKLIADGNMPPQDIFGIYQKKTAVVKAGRKK